MTSSLFMFTLDNICFEGDTDCVFVVLLLYDKILSNPIKMLKKNLFIARYSRWISSTAAIFNHEVENLSCTNPTRVHCTWSWVHEINGTLFHCLWTRNHELMHWMERSNSLDFQCLGLNTAPRYFRKVSVSSWSWEFKCLSLVSAAKVFIKCLCTAHYVVKIAQTTV